MRSSGSPSGLGLGTVGREAHPAARNVDQAQLTPKACEVKPPTPKSKQEIVELP